MHVAWITRVQKGEDLIHLLGERMGDGDNYTTYEKRVIDEIRHKLKMRDWQQSAMNCVECGEPCVLLNVDGVNVDYCRTCRGFWFDTGELSHFTKLLKEVPGDDLCTRPSRYKCPVCHEQMLEYQFMVTYNLLIDGCPHHHGVYLEDSELERAFKLRDNRML